MSGYSVTLAASLITLIARFKSSLYTNPPAEYVSKIAWECSTMCVVIGGSIDRIT